MAKERLVVGATVLVTLALIAMVTVTATAAADSHHHHKAPKRALKVTLAGTGSGKVTSQPSGISCGSKCGSRFKKGTSVKLKASPNGSSVLRSWSGCDSTSGKTCTVKMGKDRQVTATFTRQYTLAVTRAGTGSGKVTSTPAGINCGATCKASFDSGKSVTLTPTPTSTSNFGSWKGCTTVSGKSCTVKMSADRSVSATFLRKKVPLHFHLKNAVGLALRNAAQLHPTARRAATDTGSNLEAVNGSGQTTDAVDSGSAIVSNFLVAPNDKVYVLFSAPVNLADTTQSGDCLLAEVNPDTGTPICIDQTLSAINWESIQGNPAIQFDASGAIYYIGTTTDGKTVLRKYVNGTTANLINDNIQIHGFLVRPDGSVILLGYTVSTGADWIRRVTPTGGLQNLSSDYGNFLSLFPDGNVYIGRNDPPGVSRFLTASNQVDPKYWIGGSGAFFDYSAACAGPDPQQHLPFCNGAGGLISKTLETTNGTVFALACCGGGYGELVEYYPTLGFPTTAIQRLFGAEAAGNQIVLTGLNNDGQNLTKLYDPSDDSETQLIGPSNEIEIYHLAYSPDHNEVLFDGLRFANNTYVLGKIDLSTNQVTVLSTTGEKWEDFQALG